MMQLTISAFGIARDILGKTDVPYELPPEATVGDLLSALKNDFPGFDRLASLMVAVNAEYATQDQVLGPNDEIVLIPPVSGG